MEVNTIKTQTLQSSDLGASYNKIALAIKNHQRFIITDDNGKGESIIISINEYDAMKEAAWQRYVSNALAAVEAVKDNPETWLNLDEFWQE